MYAMGYDAPCSAVTLLSLGAWEANLQQVAKNKSSSLVNS